MGAGLLEKQAAEELLHVTAQEIGLHPREALACGLQFIGSCLAGNAGDHDLARTSSLVSPISLDVLVIAESGERKATADRRLARPIRLWQQLQQSVRRSDHEQQKDRRTIWTAKRDGLLAAITKGGRLDQARGVQQARRA